MLGRLTVAVVLVTAVGVAGWAVAGLSGPSRPSAAVLPAIPITAAAVQPGAGLPAAPGSQPVPAADDVMAGWAGRLANTVGIPRRALQAYGVADLVLRAELPGCRVNWATLAGIGRIESDHGRFGGAELGVDGRPSTPIIGVALDGSPGLATITDTDAGRLDGDADHDRAVGPMQFIPGTWSRWGADGDGDGRADPQDIDDAAVAAGRYLCAGGRDLGTAGGWWEGVLSYNRSVVYGQKVFGVADAYARRSTG